MSVDNTAEVLDIVTGAVDKHLATDNYEKAAQLVKEGLDRKFGASWHCVMGEVGARARRSGVAVPGGLPVRAYGRASTRRRNHAPRDPIDAPLRPNFVPRQPPPPSSCAKGFSYNVTYQARNTLFCFYAEKLGVLVWKA